MLPRYVSISDLGAIQEAIALLDTSRPIAMDCEGDLERGLSLIEFCDAQSQIVIVDCFKAKQMDAHCLPPPLLNLITSNDVEKVCFGCLRMRTILQQQLQCDVGRKCWDLLAIGLRLLDDGGSQNALALGELLEEYGLRAPLPSEEELKPIKNWFGRPLTPHQRFRAERQVQFLLPLHAKLLEDGFLRGLDGDVLLALPPRNVKGDELRDPTSLSSIVAANKRQSFKQRLAKAKREEESMELPPGHCYHFHCKGHCPNLNCKFTH